MNILDVKQKNHVIEIIDPTTGKPMGLKITQQPYFSEAVKAVEAATTRAINDAAMQGADQAELLAIKEAGDTDMLAVSVVGWEWKDAKLGAIELEPVDFTDANLRAVLTAPALGFIRRQIDMSLGNHANFIEA